MCILSIISRAPIYPTEIIRELGKAQLIVVEGTVYPLLARLKNGGLLSYEWQESSIGPPRKYYQITDQGKSFLGELKDSWNQLVHTVNQTTQNLQPNE